MKLAVPSQVTAAAIVTTAAIPQGSDKDVSDDHAFVDTTGQGPTAAQFSHVQLFNAAASGKIVYVDSVTISNDNASAQRFSIGSHGTALTIDSGAGKNKKPTAPAATSHLRQESNVAGLGAPHISVFIPATSSIRVEFTRPYRLEEARGCIVRCEQVNMLVRASYEWREY